METSLSIRQSPVRKWTPTEIQSPDGLRNLLEGSLNRPASHCWEPGSSRSEVLSFASGARTSVNNPEAPPSAREGGALPASVPPKQSHTCLNASLTLSDVRWLLCDVQ